MVLCINLLGGSTAKINFKGRAIAEEGHRKVIKRMCWITMCWNGSFEVTVDSFNSSIFRRMACDSFEVGSSKNRCKHSEQSKCELRATVSVDEHETFKE